MAKLAMRVGVGMVALVLGATGCATGKTMAVVTQEKAASELQCSQERVTVTRVVPKLGCGESWSNACLMKAEACGKTVLYERLNYGAGKPSLHGASDVCRPVGARSASGKVLIQGR